MKSTQTKFGIFLLWLASWRNEEGTNIAKLKIQLQLNQTSNTSATTISAKVWSIPITFCSITNYDYSYADVVT